MLLKVEPNGPVPVYAQIVAQVKHAATTGVLRPGDPLPSLRDTARTLRINPNTVAKAYRELEAQGIVHTDHGRGTFVSANGPRASAAWREEQLESLTEQFVVEAYHLGATPEEITGALQRRLDAMRPAFEEQSARKDEGHE